jgi:hypothetical protein
MSCQSRPGGPRGLAGPQQPGGSLDDDGLAAQLTHDQRCHAARAVAAGADLAAVVVADAQENVGAAVGRRLQDQQLVAAHALAAVGDGLGQSVRQREGLGPGVHDHEVIAQPVHLDEGATAHGGVIWP